MRDYQRAAYSKRLFAFLADLIVASILVTGIYLLLSTFLDVEKYRERYDDILASYEEEYGVTFGATQDEFDKMSDDEKDNYRAAVEAMNGDKEANAAITTSYTYTFIIFTSGILFSMILLEFVVPLLFKDGRTLGKKLFGLGVMRRDHVRISSAALFARGVIGKGVLEIILPVLILLTINYTGVFGIALLAVYVIAEFAVFIRTGDSLLHDVLAFTAVVDWASQRIFADAEERDAFIAKQKAEEEERKLY